MDTHFPYSPNIVVLRESDERRSPSFGVLFWEKKPDPLKDQNIRIGQTATRWKLRTICWYHPTSQRISYMCSVMLLPFHWQWCRTCFLPLPPGWHSHLCHNTPDEEIQRRSYLAIDFPVSQCCHAPAEIFSKENAGRMQSFTQRYTMKLFPI